MLIIFLISTPIISSQLQSSISVHYIIYYDPLSNEGILEAIASLSPPPGLEPPYEVSIPIHIFDEDAELFFLNYTVVNLQNVITEYNETIGNFVVIFDKPGTIKVYFTIKDIFYSVDSIVHSFYVNTAVLEGVATTVKVELLMPGEFRITNTTLRGETAISLKIEDNTTRVVITGFGEVIVDLYSEITELTETPAFSVLGFYPIIAIIALMIIIIAVLLIFMYQRRKTGLELETVDYTRDDVTKALLKLLKESGNRGLSQAEITKHTGLPKSSISRRIRRLEEEGLIEVKRVGKYNYLYLTNKGLEFAKRILGKKEDERA
ncbi:MAG: winged helix-turn-helix transcriptional regulator [Desulfurococcaceae archaeon]